MTIHRGQCALVVGPSGCGKSTVLNLLLRLYDPLAGAVMVDGVDLRSVTQDSLREQIGVVFQENVLLSGTVRENIRLGRREATDEEVEAAARVAEVHDIILSMPDGYDTRVGGPTGALSAGQRQRVAIARAVLTDPAILLLDEATSALDPASAASINESLRRIARGRTVVSVTHRLEDAPRADVVFTFQEGRLVEWGRHDDLVTRGGAYAALWKKQTGFEISTDGNRAAVEPQRLRAIPLLDQLDDGALARVAELFATEHLVPERTVVEQGDPGDRFYLIVRGKVAVTRKTDSGPERRLAVLEDGDHFGEIALLRQVPRTATVRTLTDCTFLSLAGDHFLRLVESNEGLRQALERSLQERQQR